MPYRGNILCSCILYIKVENVDITLYEWHVYISINTEYVKAMHQKSWLSKELDTARDGITCIGKSGAQCVIIIHKLQ